MRKRELKPRPTQNFVDQNSLQIYFCMKSAGSDANDRTKVRSCAGTNMKLWIYLHRFQTLRTLILKRPPRIRSY